MDRTPENIFSVYGRYGIAYVLISMPWGSQLLEYQVEEEELTDVSLDFEIEAKYSTILFCAVGEAFGKSFLQVTSNGVHNCANLRTQKSLYSIGSASAIILARLYSKTLVLVMLTDEVYTMKLLTLIKDEDEGFAISETDNELTFEIEPTVLRIEAAPENDGIYLTLCFANNRIAIWCYSSQASLVKLHDFSLCPAADSADAEESLIPYDCTVLVHGNKWHVLVAYHTGIAKHFLLREKELVLKRSRRLSTSPVRLLSEADNQESLYFVGEHCGRISILDHELVVDMIVFPDRQPESTIYCLNPFFNAQTDVQSFGFLCYESGWLTFYTIPQEISQAQDAIDIAETPRRLLYIAHLNCYVLATDGESIQGNYEKSAKVGANICIVQNGVCISESPLRDSRKETEIFRSGDVIYALTQWQVVIHGKERSWTVVGSSRKITKTATIEGRLTVLRLKQSGNKIDVRKEFSPSYSAPIYALCVFDETSLVIGHGDALEVTMLDIGSRALATQSQLQLRSPVIAIHVSGKYVFVATQKDSIMVFEYENSVLKLVAADPYPRLSVSLALINETTLVLTDKHKNLSVYDWSPTTGKLNVNCTISMPSIIIRAKRLSVPRLDSEDVLTDFTPDRHVILAAGLDGSLYAVFRVRSTLKVLIDDHEAKESPNLFRTLTLPKIIASLTDEEMRTLLDEFEITEAADVRKSLVAAMTRRTSRLLA
ncbi:Putative uncharacterized protein [Taphrina deformans PYCC 5710]|uniref:RSE1/DDB1/CPSF1 C-terminal domain-containing protein n=1 Tax=Taphrina deformans (strain PYCC 5710 / ATCC 11124 / CBS 356.35 / IMI 108563 / JCM 9778 / NBRC 8474) TaxID=1097556 RepID=R4X8C6_TAPDE|nr:Putative uncharacterized protein [Taphrina deformans PYCC 5710]|eukprot:CCG81527.1 Putative uncharacterized protein [Taphrina deformans PYCC 5710]